MPDPAASPSTANTCAPQGLCVCADDYAASQAVSEAIVRLLAQRRIHATSVMVCSPRWSSDAHALKPFAQQASIGLHLDWTSAFAQAQGHGLGLGALMGRSAVRGLSRPHVEREIGRQLDAFESVWQAPPSHVDGHQHIHQFPVIREALLHTLSHRYGSQAPWLRWSRVVVTQSASWSERLKASVIDAWGAHALAQRAQACALRLRGPLLGVYDFDPTPGVFAAHMGQWLQASVQSPSAVLMVHPALAADADDAIGAARVHEWEFLSGAQWPDLAQRYGVACG